MLSITRALALTIIVVFWLSTAIAEVSGDAAAVVMVKTLIPYGFLVLIPALAGAGSTGFALARGRTDVRIAAKRRRMPIVAANGLLVLIPSALFLAAKARAGDFDTAFVAVQVLELTAGAVNIVLLARTVCDGLALVSRQPDHGHGLPEGTR